MKPAKFKLLFLRSIILSISFLFTLSGSIFSQVNDCSFAYYNALNLYNTGKVDTAYNLLRSCLGNKHLLRNTSKSTKADIYRLSALSSILLENPDDARLNIKKLLTYQPYYKNNFKQGDLLEFRKMVDEFSVQPEFVVGVNCFKDYSTISLEKVFTQPESDSTQNISLTNEFGGGLLIESALTKRISIGLGINLNKVNIVYKGGNIPFSHNDSYGLDFLYLETPVYANYKFRIDKKIRPYFQLGIISRYYLKHKNSYDAPDRFRSSKYGTYYMKENHYQGDNGVITVFFRNYENLDLSIGGGVTYNFKKSCFDFNIGCLPLRVNTHPLRDIENANNLPNDEWFSQANETIVVDLKRILRFNLSYKYFLNFKTF
jgi:hypothetical protein